MTAASARGEAAAPLRLSWRPSRWLVAALALLAVLAAGSVIAAGLPRLLAWPAAAAVLAYGIWLATREARRAPHELIWRGDGVVLLDSLLLDDVHLQWRGPLAFLRARDPSGQWLRLSWWPDTLPASGRRALRLAAGTSAAPSTQLLSP